MATTQKSFEVALTKGERGEAIVRQWLESRGWIVYSPTTKGKAHYFDQLATKDKSRVIAIDVKTKARLNAWAATGINVRHYEEYMRFCSTVNVPFWLIFVDDKTGMVHGQELKKLTGSFNPTPYIVAWPLDCMIPLFQISDEQIKALSEYDQRQHEFNPVTGDQNG